jgi:hypothetical protein
MIWRTPGNSCGGCVTQSGVEADVNGSPRRHEEHDGITKEVLTQKTAAGVLAARRSSKIFLLRDAVVFFVPSWLNSFALSLISEDDLPKI